MGFPKKHFSRSIETGQITKKRFVFGVFGGVLIALWLYVFMIGIRESFIIFSITDNYRFWELNANERRFYNLFYAFLAAIFGQSMCLIYWFNRPRSIFKRHPLKASRIVHDQRFMNWYFLSWFSKFAFLYGCLFGLSSFSAHYYFSLYPTYNFLFVLILIVLFLQSWSNLLFTYRTKAYRWMLISLLGISSLAYGMSHINLVDEEILYQEIKNEQLEIKYHLELPKTAAYTSFESGPYIEKISLVRPRQVAYDTIPIVFLNGKEILFSELGSALIKDRATQGFYERGRTKYVLQIDKEISIKELSSLLTILSAIDVSFVWYAALPVDSEFDNGYYVSNLNSAIRQPNFQFMQWNNISKTALDIEMGAKVSYNARGFRINNKTIQQKALKAYFSNELLQRPQKTIRLYPTDELSFGHFFKTVIAFENAIVELRNKKSQQAYGIDYSLLTRKQQDLIRNKMPYKLHTSIDSLTKSMIPALPSLPRNPWEE